MIFEVLLTNITIRLFHFIYPFIFYILYFAFNIYRWSAGYTPVYRVLDYGNYPDSSIVFIIVIFLVVCPVLHLVAFGIDTLRCTILLSCFERHRKRFLEVASAADGTTSYARCQSSFSPRNGSSSRNLSAPRVSPGENEENNKAVFIAMEQLFSSGRLAYF